ncbi:MAG: hypothetical protein DIU67_006290 [Actinomycetes bacterium]
MISPVRLLERAGDRICFDARGDVVDANLPEGAAVMAVVPVTDALKVVRDGEMAGSFDRDTVARVVTFALDRDLLLQLGDAPLSPDELIESVRRLGVEWVMVEVGPSAGGA